MRSLVLRPLVLRPLVRCLPALAVVALLAAPAGAQQLYKYVGPDGRIQYTDRPPPGAQNVEKVTGSRVSTVGPSAATAAASEGAAKSSAPKTAAEQEQAFRQRRTEAEASAKKQEKLAQERRADEQQCDAMRRQLAGIQTGGRIAVPNAEGERVYLDDSQIQNEGARLQREISTNCK
jgi:Skp family chaperone for outer membrane proteins